MIDIIDSIPTGPSPEVFAFSHDGKQIYVSNEEDSTLEMIDLESRIDADMELSPGGTGLARLPLAEALPLPLTRPVDLQPGTVDQQVRLTLLEGDRRKRSRPRPRLDRVL